METKRAIIYLLAIFFLSCEKNNQFFVDSINGNDNNSGSKNEPFYSLEKINDTKLTDGSSIFLANGSMFKGSINLINNKDITITNYIGRSESNDKPIIDANGLLSGILIENSSGINISNIHITGNGGNESANPHKLIKTDLRAGVLYIVSDNLIHKKLTIDNVDLKNIFFQDEGFERNPKEVKTPKTTIKKDSIKKFYHNKSSKYLNSNKVPDGIIKTDYAKLHKSEILYDQKDRPFQLRGKIDAYIDHKDFFSIINVP